MTLENLFEIVLGLFGPLSVIAVFATGFYLHRKGLYTIYQLRTAFFWPELLGKYRDHTRATQGRTGIWYYVTIVSIALSLVSVLSLFFIQVLLPFIRKS